MLHATFAALALSTAALTSTPAPTTTAAPLGGSVAKTAAELRDRALAGRSVAWPVLTSLCTEIGGRPAGSPGMTRAKDWAVRTLTELKLKNVHVEPFIKKNAWLRGPESASLTAPYAAPLAILGLGNSPATPPGGIEAEVVVLPSFEALAAAASGAFTGKIVVVNEPMARTQTGEGYGAAVKVRGVGPALAEERGAVAFLTRSIATGDSRLPHTGATGYGGKAPLHIPAAALGVADADLLERLSAHGPVRMSLSMSPTIVAEAPAWNVVGEIPGRDKNAEAIVIGGHLDSWDPGQGAVDDGAGVSITVAAAKLIADQKQPPRRTVRVVLFGSEETGGSGDAYAKAHADEVAHMALAAESDSGSGRVYRLQVPTNSANDPALLGLATVLAPLGVFIGNDPARHAGSDIEGLEDAGVPVIEFGVDATHYFDVHHSADDTLDKVSRADLEEGVAAWVSLLWFVAESGVDFRHPPAPPPKP